MRCSIIKRPEILFMVCGRGLLEWRGVASYTFNRQMIPRDLPPMKVIDILLSRYSLVSPLWKGYRPWQKVVSSREDVKNLNCSTTLKGNSYLQKEWMDKTLWLQENRSKISSRNLRDICCLDIIYIISTVKDLAKYLFFLHPSTVSTTYMTHYKIWHTYPWSIYHILTSACLSCIYI